MRLITTFHFVSLRLNSLRWAKSYSDNISSLKLYLFCTICFFISIHSNRHAENPSNSQQKQNFQLIIYKKICSKTPICNLFSLMATIIVVHNMYHKCYHSKLSLCIFSGDICATYEYYFYLRLIIPPHFLIHYSGKR